MSWKEDYYRMTGKVYFFSLKNLIWILCSHQILYMIIYRKVVMNSSFLCRFFLHCLSKRYGLEISPKAIIGKGLYLGHAYNITVASEVQIGNNVNLHKGCTVGRENRGKRKGVPVIGNNVYVGINATVVGNIHIGNDVLIAPNSFVNFDVPDHSIVIGNPAQIHYKENATQGYIGFCIK